MDVDSLMSTKFDHDQVAVANNHDPAMESSPSTSSLVSDAPQAQSAEAAPSYWVVNAVIEKEEDGPGSRCGHTLTTVAAVGEEGTAAYVGHRLILFGGATALKGNNAAPPSSARSAGIRLAGAIADVHCYDVLTNKWSRLTPLGEPPSLRAAHVIIGEGTMVVIQDYREKPGLVACTVAVSV
ncbi:uncharacterized protein A4U43_C03F12800 [Asparagus officinalis]|uniref:Uncharacterized protein n=1 Tax=Asparagus officinalis TaxID=4686 RepID=A0A5P1FER5_ASPOF|nr:uncharacterized protein A4U43_C03F12800 [Asparagus officinalis]